MNEGRLRTLGQARHRARVEYERAHARALRAAVGELTRDPDGNVSLAAELVGVTRRTVYRALAVAADLAAMEARAGGPPAPAPYDTDREPNRKEDTR